MWFTSNNNIDLKMYEDFPFSDKYIVVCTYEEVDVITLLKAEVDIPEDTMVKINHMQATKFFTIDNEIGGFTSNSKISSIEEVKIKETITYGVNYTLIGPTYTVSNTDQIEDLPTKLRDIKLKRIFE